MSTISPLPLVPAVQVLHAARRPDEMVITTMGVAREWMVLGTGPLDLVLVPSSMGQAPAWGLGVALAQPSRRVIVANGDGSMLMNLGSLVTIAAEAPDNLVLIVYDNGVYEVTGAQATPASAPRRDGSGTVDYPALARAAGFRSVHAVTSLDAWRQRVRELLDLPGPTFIWISVAPVPGAVGPRSPGPGPARMTALRSALAS